MFKKRTNPLDELEVREKECDETFETLMIKISASSTLRKSEVSLKKSDYYF